MIELKEMIKTNNMPVAIRILLDGFIGIMGAKKKREEVTEKILFIINKPENLIETITMSLENMKGIVI